MRLFGALCLIAFTLGLGVTVAYRMHTEAMAVVVGVLCGVSASIPASLLIMYATRRNESQRSEQPPPPPPAPALAPQPPVIIMAGGMGQSAGQWSQPGYLPAPSAATPQRAPRDFTIIGDE